MNNSFRYRDGELRMLQLNELEMLIEFDRICRKNNISYSLDGGTLLGAIRHKGFIPWDDDVDVMLLKDEYEKFYQACQDDLDKERFFFQDYRTDSGYRWGYGKLRLLGTEYVKAGHECAHYKTGICIDVFPLENLPESWVMRKIYLALMYCIRKTLYSEIGRVNSSNPLLRLWYSLLFLIPKNAVFSLKNFIYKLIKEKKTKRVINTLLPFPKKECKYGYPRSFFDDYCDVEFEKFSFSAISRYSNFLNMKYDNYMVIPPKEKQIGVMDASVLKCKEIDMNYLVEMYKKGKAK